MFTAHHIEAFIVGYIWCISGIILPIVLLLDKQEKPSIKLIISSLALGAFCGIFSFTVFVLALSVNNIKISFFNKTSLENKEIFDWIEEKFNGNALEAVKHLRESLSELKLEIIKFNSLTVMKIKKAVYDTVCPYTNDALAESISAGVEQVIAQLIIPHFKRWLHLKRGSSYVELGRGKLQVATIQPVEGDTLVAYIGSNGDMYFRKEEEFEDGRFVEIGVKLDVSH